MIIYPAIDLLEGRVVRLEQGRREACTVYGNDPVLVAKQWEDQGAQALHMVDLDGAFTGTPANLEAVARVTAALKIPVELGGGMRNEETIAKALAAGVKRVVIGTRAVDSLEFVRRCVERFKGESIAVGIDAKNGKVAVKGWTEGSSWSAIDLAKEVEKIGVGMIIYTDIATDGMFTGPNYPALKELMNSVRTPIIASGGVATVDHIKTLRLMGDLHGAIVGKALYDKKVTLAELL